MALWCGLLLAGAATAQQRDLVVERPDTRHLALVVGNHSYTVQPVRTAAADADLIAQQLRSVGYQVQDHRNTTLRDLEKAIDAFVGTVQSGDTVLVYYAGLCLGIGLENYLVPVDFTPKDPADAKYTSYSASRLMDRLESRGAAVVLFLDASHRNPFGLGEPAKETPLAMGAGSSSHIVLPAAPGKTAVEVEESRNSLFAGFLADALSTPGIAVGDLFTRVQEKVFWASNNQQAPVISSGGDTRRVLVPAAAPSKSATFESDFRAWRRASDASSDSEIRSYLSSFPQGAFRDALQSRLSPAAPGGEPAPAKSLIAPSRTTTPEKIEKMARVTKPEVDANFRFVTADTELLVQADAFDQRLKRDGLIEEDPALEAYVNQVGQSILPTLEPPEKVNWRFHVLRDPALNAFALPNGSIYVNSGLLSVLDNESQLAGVLAHEITHVTGRHGYAANRDYRKKQTAISIVQMVANYAPTGSDMTSSSVRSASQIAAALVPAILNASILGYARELERNADLYAIDKLVETGYDPRELVSAFRHLEEKHEVQLQTYFYNDHPKLEDRIAYLGVALGAKGIADSPLYAAQQKRFREETWKVALANVRWTVLGGQRRTAVARARKLVELNPESVDATLALADAYRALGPWHPQVQPQELTEDARKRALKARLKLTPQEIESEEMKTPQGTAAWRQNAASAEELYRKALAMEPRRAEILINLGNLFEKSGETAKATASYRNFLDAAPSHPEALRVQRKLEVLGSRLPVAK